MTQEKQSGRVRHEAGADGIGWIVLDNPARHNAISLGMWRTLVEVLARFDEDPAIRCVVIRGEGERAFCAGADIGEKQGVEGEQALADLDAALESHRRLRAFGKPIIAMISGYCLGGGMAIAVDCDLRIAADTSVFGIPAARLGIGYPYASLRRISDLVGPAWAKQILFTADRIPAQRAVQIGLVNEVVPAGELQSFVAAMAGRIAANAPLTVAAAKHAVTLATSDPQDRDIEACDARARACLSSLDYAEGRLAFQEKRAPKFLGR